MRLTILFLSITLIGCRPEPQQNITARWFDLPKFVDQLVLSMDAKNHRGTKSFSLNNQTEKKDYEKSDSSFWGQELTKLREIDLNSPQIRDALVINSNIKDDISNLLIDEYVMPANHLASLKKLSIYYLEDSTDIRQINAELISDNLMSNSNIKIKLWINRYNETLLIDSLQIVGCDKTFLQSEREYLIITKTIW